MNTESLPINENIKLLENISKRQSEIHKITHRMIDHLKQSKQNEVEANTAYKWFSSLKTNNTNLLSKAV